MQEDDLEDRLSPAQQIAVALQTVDAFAGWVTNVDTKIATLAAGDVALALFVVTQGFSDVWPVRSALARVALVALAAFAVSSLAIARHLGAAMRPRLSGGPDPNHFAFPSVAGMNPASLGDDAASALLEQAWRQVHVLSVIAVARYRHFSRALAWTGVSALAVAVWQVAAHLAR